MLGDNTKNCVDYSSQFHRLKTFIEQAPLSCAQRHCLLLSFAQFEQQECARLEALIAKDHFPYAPWIHLPLLGTQVSGGAFSDALVTAAGLIEMGIDLLDSVMDNELADIFSNIPISIIQMNAYLLITVLPDLLLDAKVLADKQKALLLISAGQQQDIMQRQDPVWCIEDYFKCIRRKTGVWRVLYFQLGTSFASHLTDWDDAIMDLGVLSQMRNDLYDIFSDAWSADLANGLYTYPVITHNLRLHNDERAEFLSLLQASKTSIVKQQLVRQVMKDAGILKESYFMMHLQFLDIKARLAVLHKPSRVSALLQDILSWYDASETREMRL